MENVIQEGTLGNKEVLELAGNNQQVLLTLVSGKMFALAIAGGKKYPSELEDDGLHHLRAIVDSDATIWVQSDSEVSFRIDEEWELAHETKDALGMTEEDWNYIQLCLYAVLCCILLYVFLSALSTLGN